MIFSTILATVCVAAPSPIVISVGEWVMMQRTAKGWSVPAKSLNGLNLQWRTLEGGSLSKPFSGKIEIAEADSPAPNSLILDGGRIDPGKVSVTGGKVKLGKFTPISTSDPSMLALGKRYAKSVGAKATKIVLQGGLTGDLNGDGTREIMLCVGTGASTGAPVKNDFTTAFVQTSVKKVLKTHKLAFESQTGYMRGPFTMTILAAADFDGDGKTEFLFENRDPWGVEVQLLQLDRAGKLRKLCTSAFGE